MRVSVSHVPRKKPLLVIVELRRLKLTVVSLASHVARSVIGYSTAAIIDVLRHATLVIVQNVN